MPDPITVPPQTVQVTTPGAPQMATDSPQLSAVIPEQQPQQAATPGQAPQTAPVHPIRAALGGWQALMGSHTEYNQTPQGPQAVQVNNKPGQLFRSILAGALLGGAAGGGTNEEANAGSGWQGAARGAGAVQQNAQQQQQRAQQSAQQTWDNQLKARQEAREDSEANEKQKLYEAQIAASNIATLRDHQLMQQQDYKFHKDMAAEDSARYSSYKEAGLKPLFDNVSETDMAKLQASNKDYTKYDWVNTGVVQGVDADGKPTWESTYSAYNPKDATNGIPISQATINQWKDDGLFKFHPEYEAQVKAGKNLSFDQFNSLNMAAKQLASDTNAKQLQDLNVKKDQAVINSDNARAATSWAEAKEHNANTAAAALGKNQAAQFDTALADLNSAGGDFAKLKPSSRVVIAESMNKMVPVLNAEYKDILADPTDPEAQQKAGAVLEQIHNLTTLGQRALTGFAQPASTGAGGDIPAGAQIAVNPKTGEKRYSTDGGKTWLTPGGAAPNPLASLRTDEALVQGPSGTTPLSKDVVAEFLKEHPDYKLVGYGTQAAPALSGPVSPPQPNNYQGR